MNEIIYLERLVDNRKHPISNKVYNRHYVYLYLNGEIFGYYEIRNTGSKINIFFRSPKETEPRYIDPATVKSPFDPNDPEHVICIDLKKMGYETDPFFGKLIIEKSDDEKKPAKGILLDTGERLMTSKDVCEWWQKNGYFELLPWEHCGKTFYEIDSFHLSRNLSWGGVLKCCYKGDCWFFNIGVEEPEITQEMLDEGIWSVYTWSD